MARREYNIVQGCGGGTPAPFCDYQIVNGQFIDTISNVVYKNSNSISYTQYGYVYNPSAGTVYFFVSVNGACCDFYPNDNYRWSTAAPNPPTNGVSPEWYGEGIRLVATLYCPTLINDSRANGSAIISCLSHNNANYVGFNISMKGNLSSFYINKYNTYSAPFQSQGQFTINQDSSHPMTIQIDMSASEYRIKLYEYGSTTAAGDSGIQTVDFGGSSKRYSPLMTSNWGQSSSTRPTVYVQSYQYYKESALTDFMA